MHLIRLMMAAQERKADRRDPAGPAPGQRTASNSFPVELERRLLGQKPNASGGVAPRPE